MKEKRYSAAVVFLVAIICHCVAAQQFCSAFVSLPVPQHYPMQFYSLLAVSFVLSCFAAALHLSGKRPGALYPVFLLQFLVLAIIGLPLGDYLGIESSLLTVLLFVSALFFRYPATIPLSAGSVLATLFLQQPISAWNVTVPNASPYDILCFSLYASTLAFSLNWLQWYRTKLVEKTRFAEQLESAILQLTSANIGFQNYATSVEEMSMKKERNRIAREMHDTIGYALTNVMIMMEAATDLAGKEHDRLQSLLKQARKQAQGALNETRRALRELRAVEARKEHGLAAIHKLVKAFEKATNVRVTVEYGEVPWSFGEEADLAVYRMIQEGLTNAFKHGKATKIRLLFWKDNGTIGISINDDGHGCKEIHEGIGISGMRERIEQLGGQVQVQKQADGFMLRARIPWKVEASR
jgi:signal transduction histidine kinase